LSSEENKAKTRRFMEEVLNKGNMQVVDELIAPNFVEHDPFPGQAPGVEGLKQAMVALRQAFPDLHVTVDEMLSDGDKVVIRSTR
jgi:predicted ester cyclase